MIKSFVFIQSFFCVKKGDHRMRLAGFIALGTLVSHLFFITLAFYVIQGVSFNLEQNLKIKLPIWTEKLLIVLLSICLGFICSSCFLSLMENIHALIYL